MVFEMDVEITETILPVLNLSEAVEKISVMKAALRAFNVEHERTLRSVQSRIKAGKRQIDICTQEFNSLELMINAVESRIAESLLLNKTAEAETLRTVRENRSIKRKIIALKHDMEHQEKLLQRANETMKLVRDRSIQNKRLKELPSASP